MALCIAGPTPALITLGGGRERPGTWDAAVSDWLVAYSASALYAVFRI
jgi:hypothetical protein